MRGHPGVVRIRGAGTKQDWGVEPPPADVVIDTTGLDQVLRHDPDDATATVQSGMPLAALQSVLAGHGQQLAVDPPHPGATVGGTFAAGDAGPRRLRYGTMRDLVIGLTAVLPDGAVSRSGGKVIKNVAGYDLGRLLAGSLGTLGLVADLTIRLHPLPETSATVAVPCDAVAAASATTALLAASVEPVAIDWAQRTLWIRYEGASASVDGQVAATRVLLDELGLAAEDTHRGEGEEAVWARLKGGHAGTAGATVAQAATLPSDLATAQHALADAADDAGVEATIASHAGVGVHHATLSGADARAHALAVRAWRGRLAPDGGHVVVRRRAPTGTAADEGSAWDTVTVWGPDPSAIALMRSLKSRLDPDHRLAPGSFVGGI